MVSLGVASPRTALWALANISCITILFLLVIILEYLADTIDFGGINESLGLL
jgi:hypothetical protein